MTGAPDVASYDLRRAVGRLRTDAAAFADVLSQDLAERLSCVPWDRAQVLGTLFAALDRVLERRPRGPRNGPDAAWVHELRGQPFESWPLVCKVLLDGGRVSLSWDEGAGGAWLTLIRQLAERVGDRLRLVGPQPAPGPDGAVGSPPWIGPRPARERIAWVQSRADPELAAYVLARGCLRRSGQDARAVRVAWVAGPLDRLERHLRRLFVETLVGPAGDPTVFSGPVDEAARDAYLEALAAWESAAGVQTWVRGGILVRAGDPGIYLAPALFRADPDHLHLPRAGPMLVVVAAEECDGRTAALEALAEGRGVVVIVGGSAGPSDLDLPRDGITRVLGAVLADRLPPGLPEPRPV